MGRRRLNRKPEIKACKNYTEFTKNRSLYCWAYHNGLTDWARETLGARPRKGGESVLDSSGERAIKGLNRFIVNCRQNGKKHSISNEEYRHHKSVTKCDSCGDSFDNKRKCLDHDHDTGKYRGTLCVRCNVAEGQLLSSVERAYKLLQYISERC